MSEPTLIIRLDMGDRPLLGQSASTTAVEVMTGKTRFEDILDAAWSHPPLEWAERGHGWPRKRMTDTERKLVAAVELMVEHGIALPQPIAEDLLNLIERVAK